MPACARSAESHCNKINLLTLTTSLGWDSVSSPSSSEPYRGNLARMVGSPCEIRTHKIVRPLGFESSAYAVPPTGHNQSLTGFDTRTFPISGVPLLLGYRLCFAGDVRIELTLRGLEALVLPLHQSPMNIAIKRYRLLLIFQILRLVLQLNNLYRLD